MTALAAAIQLAEGGWVPDPLLRWGIRRACARRLREEARRRGGVDDAQATAEIVRDLGRADIALVPALANAQHYEVPAAFFQRVLGPRLKYSCGWWGDGIANLANAEAAALDRTIANAGVVDGMRILELGCGWGSLSLWMAANYPGARITAVSNSNTQRLHIEQQAAARGLRNLDVITCDVNLLVLPPGAPFDRVVSVEMFEHMRNYRALLQRVASWMAPAATLFVHIFTHREFAYPFEVRDDSDWMARHFFTGGIMPSDDLLLYFQDDVVLREHWRVPGWHYRLTSEAWLRNMDRNRATLMPILARTYGEAQALRWWVYWRVFFMSCAELWGYAGGREWLVSHYLFEKR
jgi:cyclopropane-fatty-acyl-phospholipid synthase